MTRINEQHKRLRARKKHLRSRRRDHAMDRLRLRHDVADPATALAELEMIIVRGHTALGSVKVQAPLKDCRSGLNRSTYFVVRWRGRDIPVIYLNKAAQIVTVYPPGDVPENIEYTIVYDELHDAGAPYGAAI